MSSYPLSQLRSRRRGAATAAAPAGRVVHAPEVRRRSRHDRRGGAVVTVLTARCAASLPREGTARRELCSRTHVSLRAEAQWASAAGSAPETVAPATAAPAAAVPAPAAAAPATAAAAPGAAAPAAASAAAAPSAAAGAIAAAPRRAPGLGRSPSGTVVRPGTTLAVPATEVPA
ncbi:hypothetical protein NLX86_31125 [Streptomyces sp. A3M-1-3]|uniref:hypothetical protein n=1 Tax=Streptomyces sp. A3M-1-3 TaxID=2962044 RepID=UPI0020B7A8AB|nr:hypothetical protein [Streptomyces sp. A3M-1-3]MCP3822378.1 hypothetical protein [Streptomyces sp. A3M-1-3]